MQFWQCSISLQFLQIITAKNFAFGSLQNLQLLTSADCSVSLHAMVHCNSKCIAVIPLQFHCNFPAIVCSVNHTVLGLRLNPINPKGLDDPHWMQYPGPIQTNKQTNTLQSLCTITYNVLHFLEILCNYLEKFAPPYNVL